jgi:hypothetical protein
MELDHLIHGQNFRALQHMETVIPLLRGAVSGEDIAGLQACLNQMNFAAARTVLARIMTAPGIGTQTS